MKNDLLPGAMPAGPDDLPEQLAFEFADVCPPPSWPRPAADAPHTDDGYFVETRQLQTGNGLPYSLRLCQDCRTGVVLSYRLVRVTAPAARAPTSATP